LNESCPEFKGALNFGNNTPVPIPAAVWLLGSGMIGLWGIRRLRK